MKTLKIKFDETVKILKANKALKVEVGKLSPPVKTYQEKTLEAMNLSIPKTILDIYRQANGCHLVWREKDGINAGEIFLQPLATTFIVTWKNKLWFDWMNDSKKGSENITEYGLAKKIKGFDVMDKTLDGTLIVAFYFPEGGSKNEDDYKMLYWDNKGIKFPLKISFSNYVETALEFKAMMGWQRFFIDIDAIKNEPELWEDLAMKSFHTILPAMEEFIVCYTKFFPEDDTGQLSITLEKIKKFALENNLLK